MKIMMLLTDIYNDGGVQNSVRNLSNILTEKGFEVVIVSVYNSNKTLKILNGLDQKIKVYTLLNDKINFRKDIFKITLKLKKILKDLNPDVLIASGIFYSIPLSFITSNFRSIVWAHSSYSTAKLFSLDWIGRKLAYKNIDKIVAITHNDYCLYKNDLSKKQKNKINHIYNLIDKTYNNHFKVSSNNIVSIGTLSTVKGFDRVIQIFHNSSDKLNGWNWLIIGDGPLKEELSRKIIDNNLENRVKLLGHKENIYKYLSEAGVLVCPSRSEGFGLVNLEAKLHGIPVISFDFGGITQEIIQDNVNGFIIEDGNTLDMELKLVKLVNDPSLRKCFSKNTNLNNKVFEKDIITKQWIELICE